MLSSSYGLSDLVSIVVFATQLLLVVFGLVFFVSGVDDLFVDCCYVVWRCYQRLAKAAEPIALTEEALRREPERPIAILIPAWDESDVIRPMLANTLRTIDYSNYHIFIGAYP